MLAGIATFITFHIAVPDATERSYLSLLGNCNCIKEKDYSESLDHGAYCECDSCQHHRAACACICLLKSIRSFQDDMFT